MLFIFFSGMMIIRGILFPKLALQTFRDFAQTSYVGAVPITLDTIVVGILIFYNTHQAALWIAYALWWVAVAMSICVACAIVFVSYMWQAPIKLQAVTGV